MPAREGHVSLWHPWKDRPGQRHTPVLWGQDLREMELGQLITTVAQKQLYCFIEDLFNEEDMPQSDALLRSVPTRDIYASRTGRIVALKCKSKQRCGFFIPASHWGCRDAPDARLLTTVNSIFKRFQFEALTPPSLSEKVLRSTLPERLFISRPSDMLRRTLLHDNIGGRIDIRKELTHYQDYYSYDRNKYYLWLSQSVVDPFKAPSTIYYGDSGHQDDRWSSYAASWMDTTMIAHGMSKHVHPIQVNDGGVMRTPFDGEIISRWMWDEEIRDCLEYGYTLVHIERGYGWNSLSGFMKEWSDILWEQYNLAESAEEQDIIKKMMVGVTGRFLRSPEVFSLIHESERKQGDQRILRNWTDTSRVTTDWYLRSEYDKESAQLTPQGSYIIMKGRQALYRDMRREELVGNDIINSYIDCFGTACPSSQVEIGLERGQFKEKVQHDVYVIENQVIPAKGKMRAPGVSGEEEREALRSSYHEKRNEDEQTSATTTDIDSLAAD